MGKAETFTDACDKSGPMTSVAARKANITVTGIRNKFMA